MYRYLKTAVSEEITINKSRFIASLFKVTDTNEIVAILEQLKKQHPKADHFCYGYVLADNRIQKYSDDGEPQKTAGWPILDVLHKNNIDDCLAVVVRYYGGINLGAGGLTRAYRTTIASAIKASQFVEMTVTPLYSLIVDYNINDQLFNLLENKAVITKHEFKEKIEFEYYTFDVDLNNKISDLTGGINPQMITQIKVEIPDKKI